MVNHSQEHITYLSSNQLIELYRKVLLYSEKKLIRLEFQDYFKTFMKELDQQLHQIYGIWGKASAYLYYIINKAPFPQDNVRIAFLACSLFLKTNDIELNLNEEEQYRLTNDIKKGSKSYEISLVLEQYYKVRELPKTLEEVNKKYHEVLENLAK